MDCSTCSGASAIGQLIMTNSSSRTPFLTIRAEGALLPVDLLRRVAENDHDLGGLSHQRVRLASKLKGVQTHVEPNLPPDVLGIYVYLPKAG